MSYKLEKRDEKEEMKEREDKLFFGNKSVDDFSKRYDGALSP